MDSKTLITGTQPEMNTLRGVYDDAPAETYVAQYSPYGEIWDSDGTDAQPFKFTGEMLDGNGLQYHRARYYDPGMGVWASLDQLETANRYNYVNGNPTNFTDPSGLLYVPVNPGRFGGCQEEHDCFSFCDKSARDLGIIPFIDPRWFVYYNTCLADCALGYPIGNAFETKGIGSPGCFTDGIGDIAGISAVPNVYRSTAWNNLLAAIKEIAADQPQVRTRGIIVGGEGSAFVVSAGFAYSVMLQSDHWLTDDWLETDTPCRSFGSVEAGKGAGWDMGQPAMGLIWSTAPLDGITGHSVNISGDVSSLRSLLRTPSTDWVAGGGWLAVLSTLLTLISSENPPGSPGKQNASYGDIGLLVPLLTGLNGGLSLSLDGSCNATAFAGIFATQPSASITIGETFTKVPFIDFPMPDACPLTRDVLEATEPLVREFRSH